MADGARRAPTSKTARPPAPPSASRRDPSPGAAPRGPSSGKTAAPAQSSAKSTASPSSTSAKSAPPDTDAKRPREAGSERDREREEPKGSSRRREAENGRPDAGEKKGDKSGRKDAGADRAAGGDRNGGSERAAGDRNGTGRAAKTSGKPAKTDRSDRSDRAEKGEGSSARRKRERERAEEDGEEAAAPPARRKGPQQAPLALWIALGVVGLGVIGSFIYMMSTRSTKPPATKKFDDDAIAKIKRLIREGEQHYKLAIRASQDDRTDDRIREGRNADAKLIAAQELFDKTMEPYRDASGELKQEYGEYGALQGEIQTLKHQISKNLPIDE